MAKPLRSRSGRNLVAVARPYFGLIVVTTLLLVAWGVVAMLHMPSGIYPEVSFPQIAVIVETPALGIRDVETVITRPIEERVSIVPGVSRLQSKTVRGASEICQRRSGRQDDRYLEQRNAGALVDLASGGGSQAQIQVTSSLETLLALAGAPAAEMEHCLPVSSKTIERLACDSSIARILLNSESQVIDVGRSKRVVSEPGRRALTARDGHCTWGECDRPASRSAAHHLIHWIHGGTSDLDNLILLCHRHH